MYLISGAIKDTDFRMIAKDYYEKFEKLSGKKSAFRKTSLHALQKGNGALIASLFDENYNKTIDFMENKGIVDMLVGIKEGEHYIAYAIVTPMLSELDLVAYKVQDIIIHEEDDLENLAEGEINIRFNIYRKIVDHIHNVLAGQKNFILQFELIDSQDLCDVLTMHGYTSNASSIDEPIKSLIENGELVMYKYFNLKKDDEDELRLTRKQN